MANQLQQSGEGRAHARKRKFWSFVALGMVIALIIGGISGSIIELTKTGEISPIWMILAAALAVVGFVWFSIEYYRRIDEVDLQDNLWANFIGAHVFIITFAVWWALSQAGVVPQPDALILCGGTC